MFRTRKYNLLIQFIYVNKYCNSSSKYICIHHRAVLCKSSDWLHIKISTVQLISVTWSSSMMTSFPSYNPENAPSHRAQEFTQQYTLSAVAFRGVVRAKVTSMAKMQSFSADHRLVTRWSLLFTSLVSGFDVVYVEVSVCIQDAVWHTRTHLEPVMRALSNFIGGILLQSLHH